MRSQRLSTSHGSSTPHGSLNFDASYPAGHEPAARAGNRVFSDGDVLNNRYRIVSILGRGGMGTVYRVEDIILRNERALKLLNSCSVDGRTWRRFHQEAKVASMLDHPNIVKVTDFGLVEQNTPYLVMEVVEGLTLAEYVRAKGPLLNEEALSVFIPLCFALAHAHQMKVIHRDIKPRNIMLMPGAAEQGRQRTFDTKLLDFSVAKYVNEIFEDGNTLTKTGEIIGSPLYMSPEQCQGKVADARSDIYSLGCAMFEALTGTPPFTGTSSLATMMLHQSGAIPSLKEASIGLEFRPELERIVAKTLSKDPGARYQTATALVQDLIRFEMGTSACRPEEPTVVRISVPAKIRRTKYEFPSFLVFLLGVILGICLTVMTRLSWDALEGPQRPESAHRQKVRSDLAIPRWTPSTYRAPFSTIGKDEHGAFREFSFPERSIGELSLGDEKINAAGKVRVRWNGPLSLKGNEFLALNPQLLRKFRKDELSSLQFDGVNNVTGDVSFFMTGLTSLKSLSIDNTDFDDEGLSRLGDLPELRVLEVSNSLVTGHGIANLKNLKNLEVLEASRLTGMHHLFSRLKNSKSMIALKMNEVPEITDKDLAMLSTLPNLEKLSINTSIKVTDDGLKQLTRLNNLKKLSIDSVPVTPQSIKTFSQMPKLEHLSFSANHLWKSQDLAALKRTLPHCHFKAHMTPW